MASNINAVLRRPIFVSLAPRVEQALRYRNILGAVFEKNLATFLRGLHCAAVIRWISWGSADWVFGASCHIGSRLLPHKGGMFI
jgi:hypothetical protein